MKKICSIILLAAIIASAFAFPAFGEEKNAKLELDVGREWVTIGETFEVVVDITNNPGIASFGISISFGEDLKIVKAENGEAFSEMSFTPPKQLKTGGFVTGSCRFAWTGTDNVTGDGSILKLIFQADSEILDEANLSIDVICEDAVNENREIVQVESANAGITIINYVPGDVDGNGIVNMIDVLTLARYYVDDCMYDPNGYAVTIPNENACDVNAGGDINMMDVLMICQYYVDAEGYGVKLLPGNINRIFKLRFNSTESYEYLNMLNGKKVAIDGWISTVSPVDGSFIYLMNMPYQSCPFCKPNTNQLSNTIEVYPKKNQKFEFTAEVVQVVGKLVFASAGTTFTDDYGYEFDFKIVDAEYYLLDESELSGDLVLWQKVANSDIVTDIYNMFDYLNFVCNWCTYTYQFSSGKDYLFPDDIEHFLYTDGAQFNYGYKDGYFEGLISKVLKIDKESLSEVVTIIQNSKMLAAKALSEIESGNYSKVNEYSMIFGDGRKQWKMNDASLNNQFESLYSEFYSWFSGFEL